MVAGRDAEAMTKSRHPWVGPASGQFLADLRSAGAAIRTSDPRLKSSREARPSPALTCSAIFLIAPGITPVAPVKPPSARPVPPPKLMPPPSARADQPAQADQPSTNGSQANRAPRTAGPHCARRPGGRRQPPHAAQEPPHPPLTRASTGSDWAGLPDGPLLTLRALHQLLPAGSAFSGLTAWWLHGLDVKLPTPVEATAPYGTGVSARAALSLTHGSLPPGDVVSRLGLPVT